MNQEELIPFQEEDESSMGSKPIPPLAVLGTREEMSHWEREALSRVGEA